MENPSSFLCHVILATKKGKKERSLEKRSTALCCGGGGSGSGCGGGCLWLRAGCCGATAARDCGSTALDHSQWTTGLDKQLDTHNGQHVHGTSVGAGRVRGVRCRTSGSARFDAVGLNARHHTVTLRNLPEE